MVNVSHRTAVDLDSEAVDVDSVRSRSTAALPVNRDARMACPPEIARAIVARNAVEENSDFFKYFFC